MAVFPFEDSPNACSAKSSCLLPHSLCLHAHWYLGPWVGGGRVSEVFPIFWTLQHKGKRIQVPWAAVFSSQITPHVFPFGHSGWAPNAEKASPFPGLGRRVVTATLLAPTPLSRVPSGEGGPAPRGVGEWWGRAGSQRGCLLCSPAGIQGCLLRVQRDDWL